MGERREHSEVSTWPSTNQKINVKLMPTTKYTVSILNSGLSEMTTDWIHRLTQRTLCKLDLGQDSFYHFTSVCPHPKRRTIYHFSSTQSLCPTFLYLFGFSPSPTGKWLYTLWGKTRNMTTECCGGVGSYFLVTQPLLKPNVFGSE